MPTSKIRVKIALHVIEWVTLLLIGAWIQSGGGLESIVVAVAMLSACGATLFSLCSSIREVKTQESAELMTQHDSMSLAKQCLQQITDGQSDELSIRDFLNNNSLPKESAGMIAFLVAAKIVRRLGPYTVVVNGDLARSFCGVMENGLASDEIGLCDWTAEGAREPAKRAKAIVQNSEMHRLQAQGGPDIALPARNAKASLIILKARTDSEDVFLMQESSAWGAPYLWFIGGVEEPDDDSAMAAALRELSEELNLPKSAVRKLSMLGTLSERRVSGRLGVLTEYLYTVFGATLDENDSHVLKLLTRSFQVERSLKWANVPLDTRWVSWSDIKASSDLTRDADKLVKAITNYDTEKIPLSISKRIEG